MHLQGYVTGPLEHHLTGFTQDPSK